MPTSAIAAGSSRPPAPAGPAARSAPVASAARVARRIDVAGETINVVDYGTGPPLFFVHGFPSNALAWHLVMERLRDRHRLIAPDQVGFGRSTRYPRRPLTGDAYADRLADLLDALWIERTDVVGISWGAAVTQRLALRVSVIRATLRAERGGEPGREVAPGERARGSASSTSVAWLARAAPTGPAGGAGRPTSTPVGRPSSASPMLAGVRARS